MSAAAVKEPAEPVSDPARIGALLSGRSAPRARLLRAMATHVAPLARGDVSDLLGPSTVRAAPSPIPSPPAAPGGEGTPARRWARLRAPESEDDALLIGVSDADAARWGTLMLGGEPEANAAATPIDWHLIELVVNRLGATMPAGPRHAGWGDAPPEAEHLFATLHVAEGEAERALPIAVPVACLSPIAGGAAAANDAAPGTPAAPVRERPDAAIRLVASLSLAPRSLAAALDLRPGTILPLHGGLDAVDLRAEGGQRMGGGVLGHRGGRLCLRLAASTLDRAFIALDAPAPATATPRSATPDSPAQDRAATA